jgi:hypothetical protein
MEDRKTVVSIGALEKTARKRARLQGMADRLAAERDANAAALKAAGFQERSNARFNPDDASRTTTTYTGGRTPEPKVTPTESTQKVEQPPVQRVAIDDSAVRAAYHAYMDTARSGAERGKALFDYACAVGLADPKSCGFRGQSEIEATYKHIQSEETAIKYGFDKDGSIAAKANASRSLSSNTLKLRGATANS